MFNEAASAIKCWQCSSHVPFCDDTFNPSNVTEQQRVWAYKECILSDGQSKLNNQRPVCKKIKQLGKLKRKYSLNVGTIIICQSFNISVYDKLVITRSCYWKTEDAPIDECLENIMPQHIKTEFCETCDHDGCNGAEQFAPIAAVFAISIAIATILSI